MNCSFVKSSKFKSISISDESPIMAAIDGEIAAGKNLALLYRAANPSLPPKNTVVGWFPSKRTHKKTTN